MTYKPRASHMRTADSLEVGGSFTLPKHIRASKAGEQFRLYFPYKRFRTAKQPSGRYRVYRVE